MIGGLAIQRQHGDRDALLVDAVIAGKRSEQASRPVHFSGIGYVIAHDGVQGAEGDGRIAVLWCRANHQRRGIVSEVVVAAHEHRAVGRVHTEGAAAEIGRAEADLMVG